MNFLGPVLDKTKAVPLYQQLYQYLVGEIRAGRMAKGEKLPGRRTAAAQLGASVSTVDTAYQMLAAEGYVEGRARSGFVVAGGLPLQALPDAGPAPGKLQIGRGAAAEDRLTPTEKKAAPQYRYSFSSSGLDPALFPRQTWLRLMREVLAEEDLLQRGEAQGEEELRAAIANYLREYRGVVCSAGQIAVGAGLEALMGMLARLLPDVLWAVEDPGYPKTAQVLDNMGLRTEKIPVDDGGMQPVRLAQSGARACCLTPSHQFPTGGVMPVGRRTELLAWAAETGGLIVEDDFDSEFRFDGRPLPCMQGLDETGSVVYAGTFSRSLAAGLRCAYMVLPGVVLARWQKAYAGYACTVSRPEQRTFARLMRDGHFGRGLNRARATYRRRRDALLAQLARQAPKDWQVEQTHTGLYFILRLPGSNAATLAARARAAGLGLHALAEYCHTPAAEYADALVLGYGGLPEAETEEAVAALCRVLEKQ